MINIIRCAIAGAIAAYGAVQMQAEDKAGMYLLLAGLVIIVVSLVDEYFPEDDNDAG